MSTITAILKANDDGTIHIPVPLEHRQGLLKVTAVIEPGEDSQETGSSLSGLKGFGCLKGRIHISPDFDEPLDDFREYME